MIDLRLVREDPEYVKAALARRGMEPRIDELLEIDARRRDAQTRLDALRSRQKQVGKEVPRLEGDAKQKLLDELKELSEEIKSLQSRGGRRLRRADEAASRDPEPPARVGARRDRGREQR